jgi:transposase
VGMDIKRLDHLGIVAGIIKELKLVEAIDKRLQKDENEQENITPGEAIAGMIMNGLGFSDKPLSLTPHFFETKALEVLFRPGVNASHFNRHKLGKVLDMAHIYGCEQLFFELSSESCAQEQIDMTFNSEDTTSLSVTGEYAGDVDEQTIKITQGYSKDHRPDLKQVIQELLVSQDGGVPLMMKSWDGNASDNTIFEERSKMLIENFKKSELPRYLIADSKLYSKDNAINLKQLNFITRIPANIQEEHNVIIEAIHADHWEKLDDANKYFVKSLRHYDIEQRWIVVYSDKARERAEKKLEKAIKKEQEQIENQLWHLSNKPFSCADDARKAADELIKNCFYHKISEKTIVEKRIHTGLGRPKKDAEPLAIQYIVRATVMQDEDDIKARLNEKSCYVIGTNIGEQALLSKEVIAAYKRQNSSIENMGFRFLKDPIFFVSSLFLKKPSRIMGLLMVMTLSLLVYSIAQRRIRKSLEEKKDVLPNQIKQPTKTPTMRWIFQLMEGIHYVTIKTDGAIKRFTQGWNDVKKKIIKLMGEGIMQIYCMHENADFGLGSSSI